MSIELQVEDYCQKCPDFEPDVTKLLATGLGKEPITTTITCKRKRRCAGLVRYLKEQKAVKDEEL